MKISPSSWTPWIAALVPLALGACSGGGLVSADKPARIIPPASLAAYQSLHYAPAVVAGDDIYLSGISGAVYEGENAVYKQFDDAFARLQQNLEAAGSSLSQVKEIYTWHVDMHEHAPAFLRVKDQYFAAPPYPTWSSMEAGGLPPGALLEVVARATRKPSGQLQRRSLPDKDAKQIGYSPAVLDGDLVYLAGLSGGHGSAEKQFHAAFRRLAYELEAAGSSMDDLIELDIFVVDLADNLSTLRRVREAFATGRAVTTVVGITGLPDPRVSVEMIARAKRSASAQPIEPLFMPNSPGRPAAVRFGRTLYLAPVSARAPHLTRQAQFEDVFAQLGEVLKAAGADFSDVVELNTYHIDMQAHFFDFLPVKDRYLLEPYPTWNGIGVQRLPAANAIVAASVRAVLPR